MGNISLAVARDFAITDCTKMLCLCLFVKWLNYLNKKVFVLKTSLFTMSKIVHVTNDMFS